MQERLDKALHLVRRVSMSPGSRDRESGEYDTLAPTELMRFCNTARMAGVSIVLMAAGAVVLLTPASIPDVHLKVRRFSLQVQHTVWGFRNVTTTEIWSSQKKQSPLYANNDGQFCDVQDMPYSIYVGAALGGLGFTLILLNIVWWRCTLRPVRSKPADTSHQILMAPRQTPTNSYPFRSDRLWEKILPS